MTRLEQFARDLAREMVGEMGCDDYMHPATMAAVRRVAEMRIRVFCEAWPGTNMSAYLDEPTPTPERKR